MTAEQHLSTRQEWAAYSESVQADINVVLGSFAGEIDIANDTIKDKFKVDSEDAIDYADSVLEYLNDNWGYDGDQFMVVGDWYEPVCASNESGIVIDHVPGSAFTVAYSNGFARKEIENPETGLGVPRIGMSFSLANSILQKPAVQGKIQLLAFAELANISLQYRRPATTDVVSSTLDEIQEAITKADSLLYLHTNHEASSFYRQSVFRQQQFLRRIIDSVADVLPLPETSDQLIIHDAKTQVLYAKEPGTKDVCQLVNELKKGKFCISGEVIGVMIPDALTDHPETAYRHPNEFVASSTGLGLIVDLEEANFLKPDLNDPTFVIPIRAIKKMRLSLR